VNESRPERRGRAREATLDGSRGLGARYGALGAVLRRSGGLAVAVTAVGVVAGLLMVATEFLTVASVDVASGSCEVITDTSPELADRCFLSGFERHGGALALVGAVGLFMAWGAGVGGSRPASFALIALGAVVLLWAVLVDLPATNDTGAIGPLYANAEAMTGPGLFTELIGGALALAAGAVRLLWPAEAGYQR
jgi:hypothetical protein